MRQISSKNFDLITLSPDSRFIAVGSKENGIDILDADLNTLFCFKDAKPTSVIFHPERMVLIAGDLEGKIKLFDLSEGKELIEKEIHELWVSALDASNDGLKLVSGGFDSKVCVWNLENDEISLFGGHKDWIVSVNFLEEDKSVLSSDTGGLLLLWNLSNGKIKNKIQFEEAVNCLALNHSMNIAAVGFENSIKILDLNSLKIIKELESCEGEIRGLVFNKDGRMLATLGSHGDITIRESPDYEVSRIFMERDEKINEIAFSPIDDTLICCTDNESIILYDGEDFSDEE